MNDFNYVDALRESLEVDDPIDFQPPDQPPMNETSTIDRLFLELSQFTNATTGKQLLLEQKLEEAIAAANEHGSACDRIAKHLGFIGTSTQLADAVEKHIPKGFLF